MTDRDMGSLPANYVALINGERKPMVTIEHTMFKSHRAV